MFRHCCSKRNAECAQLGKLQASTFKYSYILVKQCQEHRVYMCDSHYRHATIRLSFDKACIPDMRLQKEIRRYDPLPHSFIRRGRLETYKDSQITDDMYTLDHTSNTTLF